MENLVFESIHFRPFRFVRKSHLEEELTEAVESWIQQNTKTECLEFDETGGVTTILPQQEIIYIEVQSHHLYVHTQKEVLKVRGKISDFAYLAETGDFLCPHYSYLCNMKYIYEIQRDKIVMSNNEVIRISRGKFEMCKARYLRYIRKIGNSMYR